MRTKGMNSKGAFGGKIKSLSRSRSGWAGKLKKIKLDT